MSYLLCQWHCDMYTTVGCFVVSWFTILTCSERRRRPYTRFRQTCLQHASAAASSLIALRAAHVSTIRGRANMFILETWFWPVPVRFGSVWFGTVVILTRPVQWTANAFTVRFATKLNRAHKQVQFGSIWRTCICENNTIVIVIIMCSKLMSLQRFKYTNHYYIANIWCSRRSARFVSCGF